MALFLGIHKISEGSPEQEIEDGYNKYKQAAQGMGLKPLGAVYSMAKGFAYCQTEAETEQQVKEAHEAVAVPPEDVVEVKQLT